jgi:hypothetical protein
MGMLELKFHGTKLVLVANYILSRYVIFVTHLFLESRGLNCVMEDDLHYLD